MAFNIERLTIKDTFTNWRDKINGFIDIAVLAPMADENGVMYIDVPHCNAREVVFNVPVRMNVESSAAEFECRNSFKTPKTATTIQETAEAGFQLTGTEDYIPWISGHTQNGVITIYTSSYDDSLHFAGLNLDGELVNTFSWDPTTNLVTATVSRSNLANVADTATTIQVADLTGTTIPGAYPVFFGSVNGTAGSGAMDNGLTYQPRTGTLTVTNIQGNLVGNSATATKAERLMNPRKLQLGQDATGYAVFDGTADVTIPCKLNATGVIAGLYGPVSNVNVPRTNRRFVVPSFRVDEKGRITEAYTRTIEFPFPEVDIDTEINPNSQNAVSNSAVAPRILNIESILERTPGMETATDASNGLMSSADKTKLNGLSQLPRINAVGMQIYNGTTSTVSNAVTRALSTEKYSQLTVNARNGLNGTVSVTDQENVSLMEIDLSIELGELAGQGLASVDGKLTVPKYAGATSSAAGTAGLVPSATASERDLFLNGAGQWANPIGTTYSPATSGADGLMSAADKVKLDGIAAQADNVTFTRSLTSGTKIGTITINGTATDIYGEKNTDTTYSNFVGASASAAGKTGLVPAPAKGAQAKYLRGDATWQAVYDAAQMDTKLNAKANLASPALTGTPTAPTAAVGTNSTQIATTAWVRKATGNTSLNAATASKLGTATVGGAAKPIYLNGGAPKACSSTVGSTTKPVYMNAGTITASNANIGNANTPMYLKAGVMTACSGGSKWVLAYTFNKPGNKSILTINGCIAGVPILIAHAPSYAGGMNGDGAWTGLKVTSGAAFGTGQFYWIGSSLQAKNWDDAVGAGWSMMLIPNATTVKMQTWDNSNDDDKILVYKMA